MLFKQAATIAIAVAFVLGLSVAASAQISVTVEERADDYRVMVTTGEGTRALHTTPHVVVDATVRAVPESPVLAVTWNELQPGGPVAHYAVSLDGKRFHDARSTNYVLKLRYAEFDPAESSPAVPDHLTAGSGGNLWIVQYWTQGLEAYRSTLRDCGVAVHLHLWNNANIVEAPYSAVRDLGSLPFVRAVVPFHPAYKLDALLLQEQRTGYADVPVKRVNILALHRGLAGQGPIAEHIRNIGGQVDGFSSGSYQMQATLDTGQIADVARLDAVQFVDRWAPPTPDMDVAKSFSGAAYVLGVAGFDGTGVRGEVADTGTMVSHVEFQATPVIPHGGLVSGSHGTSTYGQIFASGVDPQATGLLSGGQGVAAAWGNWAAGSRYNHTAELVDPALIYRCLFQTNSGGMPLTYDYTTDSQDMDQMLFDFTRFNITHSQSNTGNQNSRAGAWSKNCVAVGGIRHIDTLTRTDDYWSGASIGPAADGRVKPELASFYDNIYTTSSSGGYTSTFGGTSGATPIVAGCFGIFYQMWHAGIFANPTGVTVFDSAPQSTTARAFIIAGATQWDFVNGSSANSNIGRDQQGWGHPDLQTLYDYSTKCVYVDETDVLTNLQSTIHPVTVSAGEPFFKASLVWRDNPGTVSSSQHLINNLDLKVTSPTGTIYHGNNGLTNNVLGSAGEALWSSPGGTPDTINSVENVFVQNPQAGTWLVEVIAASLVQDNHVETTALDADYALCVLGVVGAPPTYFNLVMGTSGVGDISIAVNNVPTATTHGFLVLSEDTAGPPGGGPILGVYPSLLTLTLLGTHAAPGNPFHWTWPVMGVFPDTSLNFGAGAVPLSLFPLDAIGVGLNAGFTLTGVTPLRRVQ